jgi:hypothetical protein
MLTPEQRVNKLRIVLIALTNLRASGIVLPVDRKSFEASKLTKDFIEAYGKAEEATAELLTLIEDAQLSLTLRNIL